MEKLHRSWLSDCNVGTNTENKIKRRPKKKKKVSQQDNAA